MFYVDLSHRLFSLERALTEPLPPVEWDVEPLIPRGNRVVVYGEFGCGKSWLLLDLAIHLAWGRTWLGQFDIARPHTVLYLDEEMPERALRGRLHQISSAIPPEARANAGQLWLLSHVGEKWGHAEVVKGLLTELQFNRVKPDVVIVETLRRVLSGSENEQQNVANFWTAVEPFLEAGITFIVSHHMKKPNPNGAGGARNQFSGSTDILAGADAGFAVFRTAQNGMRVECVKLREAEEPPAFVVSLSDVPDSPTRAVELQYLGVAADTANDTKLLDAAVQIIKEQTQPRLEYRTADLHGLLAGFALSTRDRAVKACVVQGILTKARRGKYNRADTTTAPSSAA